jgi:hypothetical protein
MVQYHAKRTGPSNGPSAKKISEFRISMTRIRVEARAARFSADMDGDCATESHYCKDAQPKHSLQSGIREAPNLSIEAFLENHGGFLSISCNVNSGRNVHKLILLPERRHNHHRKNIWHYANLFSTAGLYLCISGGRSPQSWVAPPPSSLW